LVVVVTRLKFEHHCCFFQRLGSFSVFAKRDCARLVFRSRKIGKSPLPNLACFARIWTLLRSSLRTVMRCF